MRNKPFKILAILVSFCLLFEQTGLAQLSPELDLSSRFASISRVLSPDTFRPIHLRYLQYMPKENNFKLLLDKGDEYKQISSPTSGASQEDKLKDTTRQLLSYFYIGLTLPNDSFWVNLRPDSPDNIIDPLLAQTDIGRVMLEADLNLKKDTAQFTSPSTPEGREYWDKLYKKAFTLFGSDSITIPTLTRPWIVPNEVIIRESADSAYIYKATLKVMLEQDYLKDSSTYSFTDPRLKELNDYSSELMRTLIIPKLNKEVNSSKRYAPLRQVYYSLIMAQWFKARNRTSNALSSRIDSRNLTGLTSTAPWDKDTYFKAYQKSFKDGEYNLKEQAPGAYSQSIRTYTSGGMNLDATQALSQGTVVSPRALPQQIASSAIGVQVSGDTVKLSLTAAQEGAVGRLDDVFGPDAAADPLPPAGPQHIRIGNGPGGIVS